MTCPFVIMKCSHLSLATFIDSHTWHLYSPASSFRLSICMMYVFSLFTLSLLVFLYLKSISFTQHIISSLFFNPSWHFAFSLKCLVPLCLIQLLALLRLGLLSSYLFSICSLCFRCFLLPLLPSFETNRIVTNSKHVFISNIFRISIQCFFCVPVHLRPHINQNYVNHI